MERKYYTYGEILFSFREEYKRNEELLKKLKNYVLITGKDVEDYSFKTKFSNIYLKVKMRQGIIEKFLTQMSKLIGIDSNDINILTYLLSTNGEMKIVDSEGFGLIPQYKIENPEVAKKIAKEAQKYCIDFLKGTYFGRCAYYKGNVPVSGERMYIKQDSFDILLPSSKSPFRTISYYPNDILVTKRCLKYKNACWSNSRKS